MKSTLGNTAILFLLIICVSCGGASFHYGNYYGSNDRLEILPDSTFRYGGRTEMGSYINFGYWSIDGNRLLLHGSDFDPKVLRIAVQTFKADTFKTTVVMDSKWMNMVKSDVIIDGVKVGEFGREDTSFVYYGRVDAVQVKTYITALFNRFPVNDTLCSEYIEMLENNEPSHTLVKIDADIDNFYRLPMKEKLLKIRNKSKLFYPAKKKLFRWDDPLY